MKFRTFVVICMIAIFHLVAGAKFANIDVDPECLLDGTTRTKPYHGRSDTSSWSMPVIYSWNCISTSTLKDTQKEHIYTTLRWYFLKKWYIIESTSWTEGVYESMNEKWRNFVNKTYFPLLKKLHLAEFDRGYFDDRKIVIYMYAASVIGYDYRLQK